MNSSFFTRGCIVKKFGLDDVFISMAVVLGLAQTATIILQVENGRGRHASTLHLEEFNRMLMVCSCFDSRLIDRSPILVQMD